MEEGMAARYWCYACSQVINPIMEVEINCPFCQGGFVEEMTSSITDGQDPDSDLGSDRTPSLWAPILLEMMGTSRRRRRYRRMGIEDDDVDDDNNGGEAHYGGEIELEREIESIISRRRRSSATILQLLQGIRAGMVTSETENSEGDRDRERESVILINPFNQTIIVRGSYDSSSGQNQNQNPIGSFGDYFVGPSLDMLLQHLADNDPNRYGTPPAQKEAIEALPTAMIKDTLQCSVCLDDFEIGTEAKEMPCKHRFHSGCILPWLELHSSCPVCRYQLPVDASKLDSERSRNSSSQRRESENNNSNGQGSSVEEGDGEGRNGNGRRFSFPWPFNVLFSSSSSVSQTSGSSNSSSSTNAPGDASPTDET